MRFPSAISLIFCFIVVFAAGETTAQKKEFVATIDTDGVQRIEITAGEYFFEPQRIVVKVNVPVEIRIKKEPGLTPHRFILSAPEAGIDIKESLSSEPKTISFTPAKTGEFPFYCDQKLLFLKSHRERGMEGVLEVRE
jgi:plastocyanin domain-containing protein